MTEFKILLLAAGEVDDLFFNAVESIAGVGISLEDVVVAGFRSDIERVGSKLPSTIEYLQLDGKLRVDRASNFYANYGTSEFSDLMDLRFQIVKDQLVAGRHIIYADLDVAWIRNPLGYLREVLKFYDFAAQTEPAVSFPPIICMGFFAMRPTQRSIDILDAHQAAFLDERKANPAATTQMMLVRMLEAKPHYLHSFFALPEALFPAGVLYRLFDRKDAFEGMVDEVKPFIFHANWVIGRDDKVRLLKRASVWGFREGKSVDNRIRSGTAMALDPEFADVRILSLLRSKLPENPVIFDIGASNGAWTWRAAKNYPAAEFHLFEPVWAVSDAYDAILQSLLDSPIDVTRHTVAIGERQGQTTLHLTPDKVSSTTVAWNAADTLSRPETVPVTTIDEVVASGVAPSPHLIKADIQAGELDALRGATKTLPHVAALFLETWLTRGYGPCTPLLIEIANYLAPFGFRLFDLGDVYRSEDGTLHTVDACFVRD